MKKYNKAFKFRILPTKEQEILIHKTFGSTRLIYNMFLDKRIKLYEGEKKSTTYNTQAKELTSLKKELEFLKEVDSMSLQITLKNLDKSFQGFFKKITKYPKFQLDIKPVPNENNAICIEDLDLKSMKIKNLAKHTFDNAWGMFVNMLEYKAIFAGKQVIKIDRYYPSSKTCSSCGAVKSILELNERIYKCECGLSIDRDLNASYNILSEGKKLLAY